MLVGAGHKILLMRAGSGQGSLIFFSTCFCNGLSFQSEYLDTFYKVVSRKKNKTKQNKYLQLCSGFFIETDESMMHEKAVRLAEGG